MDKKPPLINILTYKLDYKLSNQIYNEYQSRLKEAAFLIQNYKTYYPLRRNMKTVELLLALSIFHKRVIANLDAAIKFYGTVNQVSQADTIKMGSYSLTGREKNKLLGVTMSYDALISKFSVPSAIMDYVETRDFLKKLISLKYSLFHGTKQNKTSSKEEGESDLPF